MGMRAVQRAGINLMLIVLSLVGLGVVMIYSASSVLAQAKFADSSFYLERQFVRAGIGAVIMLVFIRIPTQLWARYARLLLLAGLGTLILVAIWGQGPANRWLYLPGFSFQPSEFAKLALVLYLADVLDRKRELMPNFKTGLLPRLPILGLVLGLIALQPDLGTAIAIGLIAFTLLWVGGAKLWHLLATALAGGGLALLTLAPYQWRRIMSYFGPGDAQGDDYQIVQSLLALGRGGPLGVGLGNSMQKQQFLPEPHTDFVFAFVGEELGLGGTLSVIALFVALAFYGLCIARQAPTYFGFLAATGITCMISVYALLNIGVVTGVLPTTGLPLPFISYGGSSLIWNFAGVGILIGIARQPGPEPEPVGGLARPLKQRVR
ncbi:MAG: putative lipid II flippase FtsW [Candidatus Latescibacteria bacterium]|nr:putative lipid II flippase FtsW [Candidatus Latescibacterota bacterium]